MFFSKDSRFALSLGALAVLIAVGAIGFVSSRFAVEAQQRIEVNVPTQGRALTPAGNLILDAATNQPAAASLTVNFVRSPDKSGADGQGRYLIAVNSGFGMQPTAKSRPQQSLSVIDLNRKPAPTVIQNVYFPSPNSANFGVAFAPKPDADGRFQMFVAGGYENRVWQFGFDPNAAQPVAPANKLDAALSAPSIDVSALAENAPSPDYNNNTAAVYPTGIAVAPDGNTLFLANNLGDSLGVISDVRGERRLRRVDLHRENSTQFLYPYDVQLKSADKVYVSLWGDGTIAECEMRNAESKNQNAKVKHIQVGRHPTAMIFNRDKSRLFAVNSDDDSVSVIDTNSDKVINTISVKLAENTLAGMLPEGLALSQDEQTLYVANARANAVAVVNLAANPKSKIQNPKLQGFIPTGNYASAVAVVGKQIFVANGKGTGVENSSITINDSGRAPNMPNDNFPPNRSARGAYNPALVLGNISLIDAPDERALFDYSQAVMRNNALLGDVQKPLFGNNRSPFKHVIYVIRENRTYDQVFGDLDKAGDGRAADGDGSVAIFGAGSAAKSPNGVSQNITPNARALALRFGLLDRFFVNAEASPDGHNWSTAAFSNDYVDKAFRWNYSGRGRTYDFEGFNRLPSYNPPANQPPGALPPVFDLPATADDLTNFQKRYIPYLQGNRDVGEPQSLYLWDAASRAGLSYRNYGEYVATISAADLREVNTRKAKTYPDLSPTVAAFAVKKSLENHFSTAVRNFDTDTPDAMTIDSYRAAVADNQADALISDQNANAKFRGSSRAGDFLREFLGHVADLQTGKGDTLPNLSILRFSNDHTAGLRKGIPTPQFFVAENDYALGRLVETVSNSPYWKDTAIFVVEDDAQDGADHVDAHRSPAFVISAYNRAGALVHDYHNTVSLIRTLELCVGIQPMNFLDQHAAPINIFTAAPDLSAYKAVLPTVAPDNLTPPDKPTTAMLKYMKLTDKQNLTHADLANPREMNEIIWFAARGENEPMPNTARLPAFDLMRAGMQIEADDKSE